MQTGAVAIARRRTEIRHRISESDVVLCVGKSPEFRIGLHNLAIDTRLCDDEVWSSGLALPYSNSNWIKPLEASATPNEEGTIRP